MNVMEIRPNEFTIGFTANGDIFLWGSIPAEKMLEEAADRIREELAAALAGREAYEAKKIIEASKAHKASKSKGGQ